MKHLLALFLLSACALSAQQKHLQLTPCTPKRVSGLCGAYSVPEDRTKPGGRQITLRIFVVPGPHSEKKRAPLFLIDGGPGQSTVEHLEDSELVEIYHAILRDSDIVAVEERGVGGLDALICPSDSAPRTSQSDFLDYADIARACLPWAKAHAALNQYHSLNAVADLEELRAAMGVDKINLWALSHGTREEIGRASCREREKSSGG